MPSLRELQQEFAAAVLAGDGAAAAVRDDAPTNAAAERIAIYRRAVFANYRNALGATYPVVKRLVGAPFFDAAVDAFVARASVDERRSQRLRRRVRRVSCRLSRRRRRCRTCRRRAARMGASTRRAAPPTTRPRRRRCSPISTRSRRTACRQCELDARAVVPARRVALSRSCASGRSIRTTRSGDERVALDAGADRAARSARRARRRRSSACPRGRARLARGAGGGRRRSARRSTQRRRRRDVRPRHDASRAHRGRHDRRAC